ncbi:hypothetical protein P7E02_05305 [Enterococcus hulanensis]|uniref:hypothetical protein n=1 Tax=Enterococcus hulanensis TaxID=2559929 RepID=UPI00288CB66F|nr:hypothetical protein [Enterococcus hulanensis]MDT2659274.1 hypothetical protein [Enterococcus hulanensis]
MKKFKIMVLLLTGIIVTQMGTTVFAEEADTPTTGQNTEVVYNRESTYTLRIPKKIDLSGADLFGKLSSVSTTHDLAPDLKGHVSVKGDDFNGEKIALTRQNDPNNYQLTTGLKKNVGSKNYAAGDCVHEFEGTEVIKISSLYFEGAKGTKKAGNYKTTLVFTAELRSNN